MENLYIIEFNEIHPVRIKVKADNEEQAHDLAKRGFGDISRPGPVDVRLKSIQRTED